MPHFMISALFFKFMHDYQEIRLIIKIYAPANDFHLQPNSTQKKGGFLPLNIMWPLLSFEL